MIGTSLELVNRSVPFFFPPDLKGLRETILTEIVCSPGPALRVEIDNPPTGVKYVTAGAPL
jgi:hypothetical protein